MMWYKDNLGDVQKSIMTSVTTLFWITKEKGQEPRELFLLLILDVLGSLIYNVSDTFYSFETFFVHLQVHSRVHFKSAALHLHLPLQLIDAAIDIGSESVLKALAEKLNAWN